MKALDISAYFYEERRNKLAKETQIGELVINLKTKVEGLEKGLETAKKKLQEIEQQNEHVENSNSKLDASFIAMSVTAVASLVKIKSAVDEGVKKYNSYTNSMNALQKTAKATDNSMEDIKASIEEVNKLKLMDDSDVTSATKNLLTYGFTVEQTTDILKVLQDAAVGNRQENYSLSEAVRVTTEGIRMENSVLSDAAGVQKNIAKMYEEYAESINKSTDSLTQAEKAQAVYNGIMNEASMFTGSAKEMSESYQGQQARLNASNLELSRTIGESMIPVLEQYKGVQLDIVNKLSGFVKGHKTATTGLITFTTAILATVVAVVAVKKAIQAYTKETATANIVTKSLTGSVMSNPLFIGGLEIAIATTAVSLFTAEVQKTIDRLKEVEEVSKSATEALMHMNGEGELSDTEQKTIEKAREEASKIVKIYQEKEEAIKEIEEKIQEVKEGKNKSDDLDSLEFSLTLAKIALADFKKENEIGERTLDNYIKKVELYNDVLKRNQKRLEDEAIQQEFLTKTNVKAQRENLVNIAQTKADIQGKQELLNILKQGETTTEEYTNAKSQLVKVYPELAKVNENTINSTQALIDSENAAADAEWALAQTTILNSIAELTAMQANDEKVQQIADATRQKTDEVRASIENATNALIGLSNLTASDFKGSVTPTYAPKVSKSSGGSKSYSNKALDNYKKQIEHKKSLDQLSLQQEIAMYEIALKKYAKTADEKMELTEQIYSLQKELQEKTLEDYKSDIEHRKALDQLSLHQEIDMYQYAYDNLANTTEQKIELEEKLYELRKELQEKTLDDYRADIEHRKALDQLSLEEEISMYQFALDNYANTTEQKKEIRETLYNLNKELAQKEKELLQQQTEDYETYMEQQKTLRGANYNVKEQTKDYDEIIKMHKNYLNQIMNDERLSLQERKEIYREELSIIRQYEQQKRDLRISSIDNTVSHLKNAITKQLEEMQEKEKDLLDKNLEAIEKWKEARINAVNEEYDARIEAIQKELDALDKAEEQKTRDEEDAEYEKKKLRLEQLIAFEHDATTKANYQKELDKLIADYQKTIDKRTLADKKEALNEQKELLKQQQTDEVEKIEKETENKKAEYEKQLTALEEYYNQQIDKAEETAQQMLLNAEKNQNQILELLKKYGDGYEITGQTFGEKLGQGFADKAMEKIQNVINNLQIVIDNAIESNIARLATATEKYSLGIAGSTVISKTVNVNQNNTITSPVDSPSTAYKKQETLNRNLASQIASVF